MPHKLLLTLTCMAMAGMAYGSDGYDTDVVVIGQGFLGLTFLAIVSVIGMMALVWNYRNVYHGKQNFIRYALSNPIVRLALGCLGLVFLVNLVFGDPEKERNYAGLAFAREHNMHVEGTRILEGMIQKTPFVYSLHHDFVTAYYAADDWDAAGWDARRNDPEVRSPLYHYSAMLNDKPLMYHTIGLLGRGMTLYYEERFQMASETLKAITREDLPYRNLYLGRIALRQELFGVAEEYFKMEIRVNPDNRLAVEELGGVMLRARPDDLAGLKALVEDEQLGQYVPRYVARNVHVREGNLFAYAEVIFGGFYKNVNMVGFLAALLGLAFWASFLQRVNPNGHYKWPVMLAVVAMGCLFCLLALPAYDYFDFVWGFHETGELWADFMFSWLGIGLIEESVKFIPLFLLWRSTKLIKTPMDFVIYASLSGLGFAFLENLLVYFKAGSETLIHTRLLITILVHMFSSATIAFGVVLAKYKFKRFLVPITVISLLVASLFHGLFDFFLINQTAAAFVFFSFVLFLYASFQYATYLNNALNQDPQFNPRRIADPKKLALFLLTGLVGLLMFEFVSLGLLYGSTMATSELLQNLSFSSFGIFFLVMNLSNIDVVKGEWVWLRPWSFKTHQNYNAPLGKRLILNPVDLNSVLNGMLPAAGEIVARIQVNDDNRYYIFKFEEAVQLLGHPIIHVIIRAKDMDEVIEAGYSMEVMLIAFRNEVVIQSKKQNARDFKFLDNALVS